MRHFLRTLKFSYAYRLRLLLSVGCALGVAVFWSLNLSAILPVLKILSENKNLHQWVDGEIERYGKLANDTVRKEEIDKNQAEFALVEGNLNYPNRDDVMRRLTHEIARNQREIYDANMWVYRYGQLKSKVIRHMPTNPFETFVAIMGLLVVGVAIKGVFDFLQEWLVGSVVNMTLFDLRNRFYQAVIHQDMQQLHETGTTDLMSRFTNDMEQLGQGMKTLYGRMVVEPLKAIGCVVAACFISWQLTLVFLILVPLALITLTKLSRMMRRAARKLLERMSDIYKILHESIDGAKVVKAFTMEPYERGRFRKATQDYYDKAMRVIQIDSFAGPMVELFGVFALGVALCGGAYLVLEGQRRIAGLNMSSEPLTFASLLMLYAYLAAVADPVRKLSSVYTKIQAGAVAAERIFQVYDLPPKIHSNAHVMPMPRHSKTIEFR
ncbi:MAG: ABC transporter transmembrane domain-containing protein, partial [Gemmataceae bacterium]